MELGQLKYFQTIVSAGSLTAAARVLGVSQPTLSVTVQNLEEELGTRLLLRGPRGVEVTATGKELLRHVQTVFDTLERAQQSIHGLEEEDRGSFTVGCHESLGAYFLPGFLGGFLEAWPNIDITLSNANSAQVRQAVISREIHFGLVVNPRPHPDMVMVDLFADAVAMFTSSAHLQGIQAPEGDETTRAKACLKKGPLIYAGRVLQCQQLIDELAEQDLLPDRLLNCGDLELVKSLTRGGIGVGLLPRRVAAYGQGAELVQLPESLPQIPDRIYLLFRGDLHRTRAARLLKDAIIDYGRELPVPEFPTS